MKLVLIFYLSLGSISQARAETADSLPKAKPATKIARINERAATVAISFDSMEKKEWGEELFFNKNLTVAQTVITAKPEQKHIVIRCCRSTGPDPLIIIDGVPVDSNGLKKLKPEDIVDIKIIKAPVSEGIYGCKATGGVILITTRMADERKIIVKDEKGSPLPGATVTIVARSSIPDTLFFTADDNGMVSTNKVKKNDKNEIIVSHVGFESKRATLDKMTSPTEIILNEKSIVCSPVHVISSGRTIRCGMLVKSIRIDSQRRQADDGRSYKVYPNPATTGSIINIQLPAKALGEIKLKLYDLSGRMVLQKEIISDSEIQKVQLPQMTAGNYHLILSDKRSQKLFVGKLMVL